MFSNRLAFAALAAGCLAAAAGGGYLASRQNAVPAPLGAATTSAPAVSSVPPTTAERPVQETEAVVGDVPKPVASSEPAGGSPRTGSASAAKRDTAARASTRETKPAARASARQDHRPRER